jgi:hypothetical protein
MGLLGSLKESAKAHIARSIDPDAREDAKREKRERLEREYRARKSDIESERKHRADIRSGRTKAGIGSYIGSVVREKTARSRATQVEEKLDPSLKETHRIDREIKGIERRKKFRKVERKISNFVEPISSVYDNMAGEGKRRTGSGGGLGMSESDIRELSGLDGLGGSGGRSKRGSGGMGMSEADIREMSGLSGLSFAGGKGRKGSSSGLSDASIREMAGLTGSVFGGGRRSSGGHRKGRKGKKAMHRSQRRPKPSGWFDL